MADYAGNSFNKIEDFNGVDGKIDISAILETSYDPLTDILSDYVDVIDNGSHTYIRVDEDGSGPNSAMNTVAMIVGHTGHGNDENDMVDFNQLIVNT